MSNESLDHQIRKLRLSECDLKVFRDLYEALERLADYEQNQTTKTYLVTNN